MFLPLGEKRFWIRIIDFRGGKASDKGRNEIVGNQLVSEVAAELPGGGRGKLTICFRINCACTSEIARPSPKNFSGPERFVYVTLDTQSPDKQYSIILANL